MKGLLFSIKRYSVHDGPGIRVTYFMKGCPLSCWWCHNPEGILPDPEEITDVRKIGEREFSVKRIAGRYYTVDELVFMADRERVFIDRSGGGVTFSGGEPMMQPEFLIEALKSLRQKGYHTAIDTSGHFPHEDMGKILPYTCLFLFDIKHLDPEKHLKYTGVSNEIILGNLERILASGTDVMLRIPVIPGINDDDTHITALRDYINRINNGSIKMINLLPYHKTGASKYRKLNREDRMQDYLPPSQLKMSELKDFFSSTGIKVKIGG